MKKTKPKKFAAFVAAKNRFKKFVADRFFLRFHIWLMLSATVLSGIWYSRCLLALQVKSLMLRYPLSVILSYATFFLFIKLWFHVVTKAQYVESAGGAVPVGLATGEADDGSRIVHEALDSIAVGGKTDGLNVSGLVPSDVLEEAQEMANNEKKSTESDSGAGSAGSLLGDVGTGMVDGLAVGDEACAVGCFAISVVLGALLLFYVGTAWLVFEAPSVLSEALFQALIAGSLVKRMKQMDAPNWVGSVFRLTWKPFLVAALLAMGGGYWAQLQCPLAVRLSDVWNCTHTVQEHAQTRKFGAPLPAEAIPGHSVSPVPHGS